MNSGIYQLTHKDTGRVYIGQSTNLKARFAGYKSSGGSGNGKSVIKRAFLKYGKDAFDFKVLVYCSGKDYLNELEVKTIALYNSIVPNGFNIELGGGNAPLSEHVKQAVSKANKGRIITEEQRKHLSEVHKARWSAMSEEQLNKYREFGRTRNLGKAMSDEQKKKISETRKARFADGTLVHHMKGKKVKSWLL
jgi:group I intron endonuclease